MNACCRVGVGTGADLPLLPEGVEAVGIDLSPDMLRRARAKLPLPGRAVTLIQADAQGPCMEAGCFEAVAFNLVLSVVPDGAACWRASLRALKPGGWAVVFDKFLPEAASLSLGRRWLNLLTSTFGTDITRRFSDLTADTPYTVLRDEPSMLQGAYRIIAIRKDA